MTSKNHTGLLSICSIFALLHYCIFGLLCKLKETHCSRLFRGSFSYGESESVLHVPRIGYELFDRAGLLITDASINNYFCECLFVASVQVGPNVLLPCPNHVLSHNGFISGD